MNMLDISFERSPLEDVLEGLSTGQSVSAAELLALLEEEEEDGVESVLQTIYERGAWIDLSDLPYGSASGEAALRLRREQQLVENGLKPEELESGDPLRVYLEEVAMTPAYGDAQLLATEAAEGNENAMLRLTDLCLGGVIETAKEHVGHGVLLLDLIQEGSLGLWQAIRTYTDGDFSSFADRAVRFSMAKAVVLQARESGLGQKMRTALEDYRQIDEQLLSELGRNATPEEISERMHLSPELTRTVQKMLENARMLAQAKKQPEPEEEEIAETQAVEDTAYFQMRQRIRELLSELDETDAKLVTLRYGLEGGMPMSPEETGKYMNMTPEEVLLREAQALAKLRKSK